MTIVSRKIDADCGGENSPEMQDALRTGPDRDVIGRLLGTTRIAKVRCDRVHFSGSRPVLMTLQVDKGDGSRMPAWAEWIGTAAEDHAEAERASLRKSRRRQITQPGHGGVLADPGTGFVLRLAGLDTRLPGLRLLNDGQAAADLIERVEGRRMAAETLTVTLVAHRLGKRAVLRIEGPDRFLRYVRVRPTKSASGRKGFDAHVALWAALDGTAGLRIPEPVGFDEDLGAAVFKPLAGEPPVFSGLPGFRACRDICVAIETLQALDVEASPHETAAELAILQEWLDRLRLYDPGLAVRMDEPLRILTEDIHGLPKARPVPCHRDLHEGQILLGESGAGLLDFDTLRRGDPALDPGNLQAHFLLAGLREGRSLAAFQNGLAIAAARRPYRRLEVWRRAAVLRLAMMYAFTDEPEEIIAALTDAALPPEPMW